jgi:cobalamin biosynthesis Mg chelatase CobN
MTYTYILQVPSPNGSQVNATTQCVADCPQGKGTAADNKAFGDCIQKCISGHYFVTSKGTPEATGSAGGSNAANSNTASAPTGTDSSETSTETGTETGPAPTGSAATKSSGASGSKTGSAAAQSSTHNAAPAIIASGSAFVGVIAALLAL